MSDTPTLETLQPITPEVVEEVLRRAGAIDASIKVIATQAEPVSVSGLLGNLARIRIRYDPPDAAGPASLIVKFSSADNLETRELEATEARFYLNRVPELSGIRTPSVYYAGIDAVSGRSYLLLQDLGDGGFVRQIDGCTEAQAATAIREIAGLHATWWGSPQMDSLSWIQPPARSPVGRYCRRWLQSYSGEWPESLGPIPGLLATRFDDIAALLAAGPRTVAHGDFHSHNLSFGADGSATIVDFQFIQHATGLLDVARFLATSLRVEVRRAIERDLLERYHARLQSLGVRGYICAESLDAFRAGLLWNLATPLALHLRRMSMYGTSWPARFPILERCITAIEDWDALELLSQT